MEEPGLQNPTLGIDLEGIFQEILLVYYFCCGILEILRESRIYSFKAQLSLYSFYSKFHKDFTGVVRFGI